jgi:hypothetical protein
LLLLQALLLFDFLFDDAGIVATHGMIPGYKGEDQRVIWVSVPPAGSTSADTSNDSAPAATQTPAATDPFAAPASPTTGNSAAEPPVPPAPSPGEPAKTEAPKSKLPADKPIPENPFGD